MRPVISIFLLADDDNNEIVQVFGFKGDESHCVTSNFDISKVTLSDGREALQVVPKKGARLYGPSNEKVEATP